MIQDIAPSVLDNHYRDGAYREGDAVLIFDGEGRLLAGERDGQLIFPDVPGTEAGVYLFSLDGRQFFLGKGEEHSPAEGFGYRSVRELREYGSCRELFAAFTAYHLWKWYRDNRFCGRCGARTQPAQGERALVCPACGERIYPRINPAVIVGVIRGDCLLITRYRRGFRHNALVAGFAEIGETLEQTVAREVMEETGVRVKNIRYYKSQPWGMAQDLLVGFYCEADGDGEIRPDGEELRSAQWVPRKEIELQPNDLSLTNEMMKRFRDGSEGG